MTFADILPTLGDMKRGARSNRKRPFSTVKVGNVTVAIYKRTRNKGKPSERDIFEVSDYTSGIRRLRGFGDGETAIKEAEKIARQLATGQVTAARLTNHEAASYGRATELARPTGLPLEIIAANYAKAFQILGGDRILEAANFFKRHGADAVTPKQVADVICELLAMTKARGKSDAYLNDLRQRLTRFAKLFGVDESIFTEPEPEEQPDRRNRGVEIASITTADVQRFLDGLGLGEQSVKNFRTVLHRLFDFAETRGYIFKGGNPVAETENVKVNGGEIEIFTPDEISKLLAAASKEFLPVIAIGAFAGLRTAEILRLEWQDIKTERGHIELSKGKTKTASRRIVPLTQNLKAWLARYSKRAGNVWTGTTNDLQDARAATVKASGVEWRDNALRHSFISYRLAEIQNAAQVALEAGNSPKVVFKHYRELVTPADAKAWFAVVPKQADSKVTQPTPTK